MRIAQHITISLLISSIIYAIFNSLALSVSSFMGGVLIDLDHVIDYVIAHKLRFDFKYFFRFFEEKLCKKAFFIFHGWEWLFVLFFTAMISDWNLWITGTLIGAFQHMLLDQLFNDTVIWSYFFFWRWRYSFEHKKAFPDV